MEAYILLLAADLLLAVTFAMNKIYQKRAGTSFRAGFTFSAITGLFTALIFWVYNGFRFAFTPFSLLIAVLLALLCTSYTLLGFRIMRRQGMSLYTLFLMTGGMTVPYLFGLFFLNEMFSVARLIGLVLIIAGVVLSSVGKEKPDRVSILLCVIVFFLNGFVSVVSKLHSINETLAVAPREFVVLSGLVSCAVSTILRFTVKDPPASLPAKERFSPKMLLTFLLLPALTAAASGVSSVLQLTGAQTIDASLLYPFITGGSIVFSTLTGWLIFREQKTATRILGVALVLIGTLCFLQF